MGYVQHSRSGCKHTPSFWTPTVTWIMDALAKGKLHTQYIGAGLTCDMVLSLIIQMSSSAVYNYLAARQERCGLGCLVYRTCNLHDFNQIRGVC